MANSAFNRALVNDKSPQLGADLDLNGFNIDFPTTPNISDCIDDDTMATASATKLATSESIKAYVDAGLATKQNTITAGDGLIFSGATLHVELSATPFLEFNAGQLQAKVLDEDNMASDSAVHLATQQSIKAYADTKIPLTQKGAANGVATLDGSGKVPVAQLPSAVMTYEGVWNASTNSPSLADGIGDAGQVYRVGTAGTQNLGSGAITFDVGDYVIYNGTIWEKSDTTDAVASVNGFTGIVVLDADDIDDTATTNKFATAAQLTKVDYITITQAVDLDALESASHAAVTLNADATTQDTLNLSGQEIQVNLATTSAAGAMSASDKTKLDGIEAGATADQIASEVPVTPTGNLSSSNVQAALQELQGDIDTLNSTPSYATVISLTQASHGFIVGDIIYNNAGTFTKAIATSAAAAEILGVVTTVTDANNFKLTVAGKVAGLSGLTSGTLYYLSTSSAGGVQTTAPTTTGQVDKPVYIAISTTEAIFKDLRGIVLD